MFRALNYYGMWHGGWDEYVRQPLRELAADWDWLRETRKKEAERTKR